MLVPRSPSHEPRISLGGVGDNVVGKYVVGAPHGQSDAVLVLLEGVVGHVGFE